MILGVGFSELETKSQTAILKHVGVWLHYRDIKNLVEGFHQGGQKTITVVSFLKIVFKNFTTSLPIVQRFIQVIEANDVEVVDQLLKLPNLPDILPALCHYTAIAGRTQIFFKILESPLPTYTLSSAFHCASERGHLEIVAGMLKTIPASDLGMEVALRLAGMNGHLEVVRLLLKHARISPFTRGWTVWLAAQRCFHLVVHELLKNGAISDSDRGAALCWLMNHPNEEIKLQMVQELTANDQPIPLVDRSIAVLKAAEQGNLPILQILLKGNPSLMRYNLETAIFWAREKKFHAIVALLEQLSVSS